MAHMNRKHLGASDDKHSNFRRKRVRWQRPCWQRLREMVGCGVVVVSTAILTALPAIARPGVLSAENANATINIRTRPTLESTSIYLGRPGDRITVIEEVMGGDRLPWYFIQLEGDNVAGWVRGDLVSFAGAQGSPAPSTPQGVPSAALESCRNRAFVELDTFRGDIDITEATVINIGIYDVSWQQRSTELTGQCTVNANNVVTNFETAPSPDNPPELTEVSHAGRPQETIHTFSTERYNARIYRLSNGDDNRAYINLWDIDNQSFALQEAALRSETASGVTVFWMERDGREYQVRVLPNNQYVMRISTNEGIEYEGNSV